MSIVITYPSVVLRWTYHHSFVVVQHVAVAQEVFQFLLHIHKKTGAISCLVSRIVAIISVCGISPKC